MDHFNQGKRNIVEAMLSFLGGIWLIVACLLVCRQSAKLSTCSSPVQVQLSQAKDIISLQKPSSSAAADQQRYGKIN